MIDDEQHHHRPENSGRTPTHCGGEVPTKVTTVGSQNVPAETIVAAAIRIPVPLEFTAKMWNGERAYPDKLTITSPPPARHHTLLHTTWGMIGERAVGFVDQGFLTSTGRYVEREEALRIALASGQPMIDHPSRHSLHLFSEDLW